MATNFMDSYVFFKRLLWFGLLALMVTRSYGQCNPMGTISNCGTIGAGFGSGSSNLEFCSQSDFSITMKSQVFVDSVRICFGDGSDTLILNPDTVFTVNHHCSITPPDSCPSSPPLTLQLNANFYLNCNGTYSHQSITTYPTCIFKPRPYFTVDDTLCPGEPVNINTTGPPTSCTNAAPDTAFYSWNYGDGSPLVYFTSVTANTYQAPPAHVYSGAGNFIITLSAKNDCGTSTYHATQAIATITSVAQPDSICAGAIIWPIITGVNAGYYNVSSVQPSTGVNILYNDTLHPAIQFTTAGTYIITYEVGNKPQGICPYYDTVTVLPAAGILPTGTIPNTCFAGSFALNLQNYFSNTGSGQQIDTFQLYRNGVLITTVTGNNVPATPLNITQAGNYTIKASANNFCGSVPLTDNFVVSPPVDSVRLTSNQTCTGDTVYAHIYPGNTTGYSAQVIPPGSATIFNNNTATPAFIFNTTGSFKIVLGIGQCNDTLPVIVNAGPVLNYAGVPGGLCIVGNNQLNLFNYFTTGGNTAQINTFVVYTGSDTIFSNSSNAVPNTNITLPVAGVYTIAGTYATSCGKDTFIYRFTRDTAVNITLAPLDTCLQSFISLPSYSGAIITLDGNIIQPGPYYIDSVRTYNFIYTPGCGSPDTFIVTAKGAKVFAIDTTLCLNSPPVQLRATQTANVTFSGTDVNSGNGIFNTTNLSAGVYDFYTVYNDPASGCRYRDTGTVNIRGALQNLYTLTEKVCDSTAAVFTNNSTVGSGASVSFLNGANFVSCAAGDSISHVYVQPGTFNVIINFTDTFGCNAGITDSVVVEPVPDARFTLPGVVCYDSSITPVIVNPQPGYTAQWWLNGTITSGVPVISNNNTGPAATQQTIALAVTGSNLCKADTFKLQAVLLPKTQASCAIISADTACNPLPVSFANYSSGANLSFAWYINGIFYSADSIPPPDTLIASNTDSVYHIKLVINSGMPCPATDSDSVVVRVYPVNFTPVIDILTPQACQKQDTVLVTDGSPPGLIINYQWGDGGQNTVYHGDTVGHVYSQPGTYNIILTAYNSCWSKTVSGEVNILPQPNLTEQNTNDSCTTTSYHFSVTANPPAVAGYYWNFGDGSIDSVFQAPVHLYTSAGVFHGFVTAVGVNGCRADTAGFAVQVYATPLVNLTPADTAVCQYQLLEFKMDSTLQNINYSWHIISNTGAYTTTTGAGNFAFGTDTPGTYQLAISAYNIFNAACAATAGPVNIVVAPRPLVALIADSQYCSGQPVYFIASGTPLMPQLYHWWFGDGTTATGINQQMHIYPAGGTYMVNVASADSTLCPSDTASRLVLVEQTPTAVWANGDTSVCTASPALILAMDTAYSNVVYTWHVINNNDTTGIINPDSIYFNFQHDTEGTYQVYVSAYNSNLTSCAANSQTIAVTVWNTPVIKAIDTVDVNYLTYLFTPVTLYATSWYWSFGDGGTSYQEAPLHTYPGIDDLVFVDLTASNSHCTAELTLPIYVAPTQDFFLPNVFTPNGDGNNDVLKLYSNNLVATRLFQIEIFNRIGEKVFESSDAEFTWDGTYKGVLQNPAVFTYEFRIILDDNRTFKRRGSVTLVR